MVSTVIGDSKDVKKIDVFARQQEVRAERYALQSVAKDLLPRERVKVCLRHVIGSNVGVQRHLATNKAFYSGLMVCGSVWTCPVCAAKISERRRNEAAQAITTHKVNGGYLAMLTLTVSHKWGDNLAQLLKAFNDAVSYMMSGCQYHKLRKQMGLIGRIKALEVTHGRNGWHPHTHIVLFYENEIALKKTESAMYTLWKNACVKHGLKTSRNHGIDLQGADQVQAYLTKHGSWSIEQELTKAHVKKGRQDSMTPFDLLRDVLAYDDEQSKLLFVEYAKAFKGRRQLHWSRGLKDLFEIKEKTDEEIAKAKEEPADLLGLLTTEEWRLILRSNQRAQLLSNIEKHGFDIGLKITLNSGSCNSTH